VCFSCNASSSENPEKLEIFFKRFGVYIQPDEIISTPNFFEFSLNKQDSLSINLINHKGKSTYKLFHLGELIEEGSFESSLGVLVNYGYNEDENGKGTYYLNRFYQPIPDKVKMIKNIDESFGE